MDDWFVVGCWGQKLLFAILHVSKEGDYGCLLHTFISMTSEELRTFGCTEMCPTPSRVNYWYFLVAKRCQIHSHLILLWVWDPFRSPRNPGKKVRLQCHCLNSPVWMIHTNSFSWLFLLTEWYFFMNTHHLNQSQYIKL